MNTVKGSFYILFQSYKKKNIIFLSILFSIVLLTFFIDTFFGQYLFSFAITISIPFYIFYSSTASKLLNNTLPYFLKLGISRTQYMVNVGLFFICWSLAGAVIITCTHKVITYFTALLKIKEILIIHPIYFFGNSTAFIDTVALDTVLLLFSLTSGLLLNIIFYRFGTVGGYSFIGILCLIPITMVIFEWYTPLFELFSKVSAITIVGSLLVFSVLLYFIISLALRKASVNPA